jgi:hypothetical protein
LLALLGAHLIFHVSRIRVKKKKFQKLFTFEDFCGNPEGK